MKPKTKNRLKRYVQWDGIRLRDYHEDFSTQDCAVAVDGGLIPVQEFRRILIARGTVTTLLFACRAGEIAEEDEFNGQWNGVFTHCWNATLLRQPEVTFRDAITSVNQLIADRGFPQRAEVICRSDVLNMKVDGIGPIMHGREHALILFDACRTPAAIAGKGPEDLSFLRGAGKARPGERLLLEFSGHGLRSTGS